LKRPDRAQLPAGLLFLRRRPVTGEQPECEPLPIRSPPRCCSTSYALAHPLRRLSLTLAAAVVTLGSALVLSGNLDYARQQRVGYKSLRSPAGSASGERSAARHANSGARGSPPPFWLLVIYAGYVNGSYLWFSSPPRNPQGAVPRLRHLSGIGKNVRPGEGAVSRRRTTI
jgi:hypothetical protein